MNTETAILLSDVDKAASEIESFAKDMDLAAYKDDSKTQAAVERKFGIIGEALNRLNQSHPDIARKIPGLRQIVDFRNLLVHGYATVIPDRVWSYVENDLPKLHSTVKDLLAELGAPELDTPEP